MEKARLLWFGYSGKDDHAHFAVIKKLKEEDSIDFFVATGVKPHQSDSKVLNEPLYMHHDFLSSANLINSSHSLAVSAIGFSSTTLMLRSRDSFAQ